MTRKQRIEQAIDQGLATTELAVVDESHAHSAGAESHFNVLVVSEAFGGLSKVERHRRVHRLLAGELDAGLHALTLTLLTPAERGERGATPSPACRGGSH